MPLSVRGSCACTREAGIPVHSSMTAARCFRHQCGYRAGAQFIQTVLDLQLTRAQICHLGIGLFVLSFLEQIVLLLGDTVQLILEVQESR